MVDLNSTKQQEKHMKKKPHDLKETLQRLQAEFENFKKRTEKESSERARLGNAELLAKLLPVIDNFELALKHDCKDKSYCDGMGLVYSQLIKLMEDEGLKPIGSLGKQFDPYLHEAMMQVESDKPDNTVLEELQKGYTLNGKVIRHAKVKLAKNDHTQHTPEKSP